MTVGFVFGSCVLIEGTIFGTFDGATTKGTIDGSTNGRIDGFTDDGFDNGVTLGVIEGFSVGI